MHTVGYAGSHPESDAGDVGAAAGTATGAAIGNGTKFLTGAVVGGVLHAALFSDRESTAM